APPKTPAAIVDKINADVNEALRENDIRERLAQLSAEPIGGTPQATAAYMREEVERWRKVIKAANGKLEGNSAKMTPATVSPGTASPSPSNASLGGLDGVNFFLAGILAGFGPYVAAYLAEQKWTQENIGFVLTASGLAGLLSQLPGGELLDTVRSKRAVVVAGVAMVAVGAIIIAFQPSFPLVFAALMLQGSTGGFLGPAIVAISLGLVGHAALPERLGRNQRFSSTGNLVAAALMGLIGYFWSYQAIFLTVAALTLPLFVALARIRTADIHFGRACGSPDHDMPGLPPRASLRSLWKSPGLLTFAVCLFLFQLANASVLPLVVEDLVYQGEK